MNNLSEEDTFINEKIRFFTQEINQLFKADSNYVALDFGKKIINSLIFSKNRKILNQISEILRNLKK